MQTFLPYSDFNLSAHILDKRRAWKQVIEAKQILCALRADDLPMDWYLTRSYINGVFSKHPAVLMWKDNIEALKHYYNAFLLNAKNNLRINTKLELIKINSKATNPWWVGNIDFHKAHQARLIEKDFNFYSNKFPNSINFNDSKYLWPNNNTLSFYII